mgnify:CR=1 FL=1
MLELIFVLVRVRGIEAYSFSTGCQDFVSLRHKTWATFSIPHEQSPRLFFTPHCSNRKTVLSDGFSVGSAGERNRSPLQQYFVHHVPKYCATRPRRFCAERK